MGVTALAVVLRWLLSPVLDHRLPFATLYGAVAVAVWLGGLVPALVAATLGYFLATSIFIETEANAPLSWNGAGGITALGVYLFSCAIVIGLGNGMRRARRRADAAVHELTATQRRTEKQMAELRSAETALRDNQMLNASVLEAALDAIITIDHEGIVLEFNPAAERIFGYRRSDILGQVMADLIVPPALRDAHRQGMTRYLATGESRVLNRRLEISAQRSDGTIFPVELAITRLANTVPPVFTAHLRDVTEQKRAEWSLREREAELELIASRTPLLLARCSRDRRFVFVNSATCEYQGLPCEEIVGRPISEIMSAEAVAKIEPFIKRVLDGEDVDFELEVSYRGRGRRFMHARYTPDRDQQGEVIGWVASISDVTDKKEAELALLEADRRKDEFLATLAHELRNPLAPIRNAIHILRFPGTPEADAEWARDVIDRQVQHMDRLIDDLMDVPRITHNRLALRKEPVELSRIVDMAVETSRSIVGRFGHVLSISLPKERITLNGDATRLAQVISNLLNNAAKYSDPKTGIELTAVRQDGEVAISIRDSGIGIPSDMLENIFGMFTQVDGAFDRSRGGLGIGLALVKRLVQLHDGSVEARSDGPGCGSEFIVRLPVSMSTALTDTTPRPVGLASAPERRRVLVVDDNEDAAASLCVILDLLGYETRVAYDGMTGLELAAEFRPDVALVDIDMPRMNGYELARRIRNEPWGMSMVLITLTGLGQPEDRQRIFEAGFQHHFIKPVDPARLTQVLASHFALPSA